MILGEALYVAQVLLVACRRCGRDLGRYRVSHEPEHGYCPLHLDLEGTARRDHGWASAWTADAASRGPEDWRRGRLHVVDEEMSVEGRYGAFLAWECGCGAQGRMPLGAFLGLEVRPRGGVLALSV